MSPEEPSIKGKKLPTLPSHKRHCPDCIDFTFPLSAYERRVGEKKGFPVYNKTTKWKCINGHITTTEMRVDFEGKIL